MELKTTILIVDDDPGVRESLRLALDDQGYHLAFAVDGQDAIDKAQQLCPDLTILDVRMPGIDGLAVCQMMRASHVLREVPILLHTAFSDHELRLKAFEAGADDVLCKPVDLTELRRRVECICRLNRYRSLLTERMRFSWFVERSSDGFLILDDRDQVRYANARARSLLDLPADETHPILDSFLNLVKRHFRCEPADAWADWTANRTNPQTRSGLSLIRVADHSGTAAQLEVDAIQLPSGSHATRVVRLHEIDHRQAAPHPTDGSASSLPQAG